MQWSPSWEANRFSVSQEITRILWSHLSLSSASSIQSIHPHPTSWRSILMLRSHLCLGLTSGLFPSGFPTETVCNSPLAHTRYMPLPSHSSRFVHPNNIGWGVQISLRSFLHSPVTSFRLGRIIPISTLFSNTLLPQCEWPSFTPIQNNKQNCSSVYLSLYIFV
jgi:hypothetical protein